MALVALNPVDAFAIDAGRVATVVLVVFTPVSGKTRRAVANVRVCSVPASPTVKAQVSVAAFVDVDGASVALVTVRASTLEAIPEFLTDASVLAGARSAFVNVDLAAGPGITCNKILVIKMC